MRIPRQRKRRTVQREALKWILEGENGDHVRGAGRAVRIGCGDTRVEASGIAVAMSGAEVSLKDDMSTMDAVVRQHRCEFWQSDEQFVEVGWLRA